MNARIRWVGFAVAALLAIAAVSRADDAGYRAGKGGISFQVGGASVIGDADYSAGAKSRLMFSASWRYALAPWLRWQLSPEFTWAGYLKKEPAPFRDPNFPSDSTKADYLTLLLPMTAQLQFTKSHGSWLFYAGGGPGAYRVWIENHRKVLKDPLSKKLHRGVYPGATVQIGVEKFLKSLSSTSLELSVGAHYVFAERAEQFPSGFDSKLTDVGVRFGATYYFVPNFGKKKDASAPGALPSP